MCSIINSAWDHCLHGVFLLSRYNCGISQSAQQIRANDQTVIISAMCLHYTVLAIKAELDQIVNGLETLDLLFLVRQNPTAARPLFVHSHATLLTAGDVFDIFHPKLSDAGSNKREKEEDQLMKWMNFLEQVEGACVLIA